MISKRMTRLFGIFLLGLILSACGGSDPTGTTPNAFHFTDRTSVALSTLTESDAITVTGISAPSPVSVTGGEYSLNGAAFTAAAGQVINGQTIKVRHTSSASYSTATDTILSIGGVSDTFTTTTVAGLPAGFIRQGGLMWTPNTIGSAAFGGDFNHVGAGGYAIWSTANGYCTATTINGQTGWRLPTQSELSALYDSGLADGAPSWIADFTWSSTGNGSGQHYYVNLWGGIGGWSPDFIENYVSCVRQEAD